MSEVVAPKPRRKRAAVEKVSPGPGLAVAKPEIRVPNKAFAEALARAMPLVGRSDTAPVLACVSLVANAAGTLTIEASNLEQALRQSVAFTGSLTGAGCVNAARLHAVARRLPPDGETTLEFNVDSLVVKSGGSRMVHEMFPITDFPTFAVPRDSGAASFSMPGATLASMLERVGHAISTEQTRFYLCGVCLDVRGEGDAARLRACATNGNDLAIAMTAMPDGAEGMPRIIVPAPAVEPLEKLAGGVETVRLEVSENLLIATMGDGDTVLATKLIGATFPDYDRVIPPEGESALTVDAKILLEVIDLCALFSDGEKRKPWVRLTLSADRVGVSSGDGRNQINSELPSGSFAWEGEDTTVVCTVFSLVEAAKLAKGKMVYHLTADRPFLINDAGNADVLFISGPLRG